MMNAINVLVARAKRSLFLASTSVLNVKCQKMYSTADQTRVFKEQKVKVNSFDINHVRVGSGARPVLLLPGAMGSIWTDFEHQVKHLDEEKFTIVAWDPPGYGRSRPPDRTFPLDFFERDASLAHDLMKTIGYQRFSLVGWSDGGITAMILASSYPDSVEKLVVVGGNAHVLPQELDKYESVRNIDNWSERMKAPMISVYGEDYFRKIWSDWVDAMRRLYDARKGDLCKDALPKIKCPTLVVHGARDAMVDDSHCTYLRDHISGAKLKIFERGAHNLHIRYHEEFNREVTDFLSDAS